MAITVGVGKGGTPSQRMQIIPGDAILRSPRSEPAWWYCFGEFSFLTQKEANLSKPQKIEQSTANAVLARDVIFSVFSIRALPKIPHLLGGMS